MKIVFAHNVHIRFQTLYDTIKIEKRLFPESQSVVGYNVISPDGALATFPNVESLPFPGVTHKIGCTNGCIATIQAALHYNPDVIVFSHDDVMLNPEKLEVFKEKLEMITSGEYDVICRRPLPVDTYGKEYYLMEAFLLSKKAAEVVFSNLQFYPNEDQIPTDARGSISPEVFLYQALNNKGLKIKEEGYIHTLDGYNETLSNTLGFIHKNAGSRGWTD
jgi:hypothetical protein